MSAFLSDLSQLATFLFGLLSSIFSLYTTAYVLIAIMGLWVLRRVFRLFEMIRP